MKTLKSKVRDFWSEMRGYKDYMFEIKHRNDEE